MQMRDDAGKSPYLPPSQSSSAAAAAMFGDQGGLFGNSLLTESLDLEVRTLLVAREKEKMKIREEILQGALLRRRELEAEVISELLMETDELKRRRNAAAGEGLSMLDTQFPPPEVRAAPLSSKREMFGLGVDRGMSRAEGAAGEVPFQRQPGAATAAAAKPSNEGPSKGHVISLAKPTTHMATSVAPAKRKFETLIIKGVDNNSPSADNNANRNLNVEYKCRLCQVTATCEQGLVEHLNGKKHKSKESREHALSKGGSSTSASGDDAGGHSQKKMSGNSSEQIFQTTNNENGVTAEDSKMVNVDVDNDDDDEEEEEESEKEMPAEFRNYFKCWCVICSIGTVNKSSMDAHCTGRTHRANLLKNGGGLITIKRKPKNARFGGDGNKMSGEIEGKVTDAAEQKK